MQYSVSFYTNFPYFEQIDEIQIKYTETNVHLIDFVRDEFPNKRIVVLVHNNATVDDIEIFKAAAEVGHEVVFGIGSNSLKLIPFLQKAKLKFYLYEGCSNWDQVVAAATIGVSDILVINDLGFSISEVSAYCKAKGIRVRAYANVAQTIVSSELQDKLNSLTFFFIRPEDVVVYEDYVDVLEFFGPLDRQKVLYDIYTQGYWNGDLSELILGLNSCESIPNKNIPSAFGYHRLNCKKRCAYDKCNLCYRFASFANVLQSAGLELQKKEGK